MTSYPPLSKKLSFSDQIRLRAFLWKTVCPEKVASILGVLPWVAHVASLGEPILFDTTEKMLEGLAAWEGEST